MQESLTGTAPSVGFVHGMINRTAGLLTDVHQRIRALITLAHAVCCDETPLRVGPKQPPAGKKKAERYLLVACTELYTHYLLGDRSIDTFTAFVVTDLILSGHRPREALGEILRFMRFLTDDPAVAIDEEDGAAVGLGDPRCRVEDQRQQGVKVALDGHRAGHVEDG